MSGFCHRVWLSGIGIADILDGTINGTVHQHMVKIMKYIISLSMLFILAK